MDLQNIERIVMEEVKKVMAERQRGDEIAYAPSPVETLDALACNGPSCSAPSLQPQPVQEAPLSPPLSDGPAILVLFTGAKQEWECLTSAFATWQNNGIRLDAIFSSGAKEVLSIEEISALGFRMIDKPGEIREIIYDLKRYAALFLPSVSRTHAAKLALGITDNLTLNMTLASLAQKVPTFASNEGLDPVTECLVCGNNVPGIQEVLQKYREHLATMGLKLQSAKESIQAIQNIALNKAESGPDLITTLVTEEDAVNLSGPVVKVARGGLVTPLAMDNLQKRGIDVMT